MLRIITLSLGQLQTNCYLAYDDQTKETLIIDPADDGQYILSQINKHDLKPTAIIATHCHFDHVLASLELKHTLQIPFLVHSTDKFLLKQTQSSARHWLNIKVDPPAQPDGYIDNQTDLKKFLKANSYKLKAIHTPGHTPGSVCFYSRKDNLMFTGDTIFANGSIGRTDFSYSSSKDLAKSIKKIFTYPDETTIYPGHGKTSTIGTEKQIHMR
jgi:glyoxylase-like metal-dependent hydrolase (beta-lactamase superfamily II)